MLGLEVIWRIAGLNEPALRVALFVAQLLAEHLLSERKLLVQLLLALLQRLSSDVIARVDQLVGRPELIDIVRVVLVELQHFLLVLGGLVSQIGPTIVRVVESPVLELVVAGRDSHEVLVHVALAQFVHDQFAEVGRRCLGDRLGQLVGEQFGVLSDDLEEILLVVVLDRLQVLLVQQFAGTVRVLWKGLDIVRLVVRLVEWAIGGLASLTSLANKFS